MIYKLKRHVTKEMLKECGFVIEDPKENKSYTYLGATRYTDSEEKDVFIPLTHSEYGFKVIQPSLIYYSVEELNVDYIKDLIDKGYVTMVK